MHGEEIPGAQMQFEKLEIPFTHIKGTQERSSGRVAHENIGGTGLRTADQGGAKGSAFSDVFHADRAQLGKALKGAAVLTEPDGQEVLKQGKRQSLLGLLPPDGKKHDAYSKDGEKTSLREKHPFAWSSEIAASNSPDPEVAIYDPLVSQNEVFVAEEFEGAANEGSPLLPMPSSVKDVVSEKTGFGEVVSSVGGSDNQASLNIDEAPVPQIATERPFIQLDTPPETKGHEAAELPGDDTGGSKETRTEANAGSSSAVTAGMVQFDVPQIHQDVADDSAPKIALAGMSDATTSENALPRSPKHAVAEMMQQLANRPEAAEMSQVSKRDVGFSPTSFMVSQQLHGYQAEGGTAQIQSQQTEYHGQPVFDGEPARAGAANAVTAKALMPEIVPTVAPIATPGTDAMTKPVPEVAQEMSDATLPAPMAASRGDRAPSTNISSKTSEPNAGPAFDRTQRSDSGAVQTVETAHVTSANQAEGKSSLPGESDASQDVSKAASEERGDPTLPEVREEKRPPDRNAAQKPAAASGPDAVTRQHSLMASEATVQTELDGEALMSGVEAVSGFAEAGQEPRQISVAQSSPALARHDLSTRLAFQIAEVARQLPDKPIEITLSPEELGKVRLSFHVSETGALNVVVAAERIETIDLMRRNIDSLISEFNTIGYEGSAFSFESFDGSPQDQGEAEPTVHDMLTPGEEAAAATLQNAGPVRLNLNTSSGMDLRL